MIGQTLAHYEIIEMIGKGGMGEVYRARDPKLDRDVAIKVLPQEVSADPERVARFQREARTLASLQHANVASVYGFEEANGVRFLVMELVEGEDIAERLKRGAIGVDDTLDIARQTAAGLEAAHEQGIVHRDLKPANVKVTPDGQVKILDFGLARAYLGDVGEEADLSNSPTITAGMTQAGVVLGTAAYMSPEQARGKAVDRRADIWAFGVMLYEMLTGRALFGGETVSDTFAAVLREEPDWDALPADITPSLNQVIRRCLVRDPKARLRDIGEARVILEGGEATGWYPTASGDVALEGRGKSRALWAVITLAIAAIAAGLGWWLRTPPPAPFYQLEILPPEGTFFTALGAFHELSPDGTRIAFVAEDSLGARDLWVRRLSERTARRLDGTNDAVMPFWSPDSRSIGYFLDDAIMRIPADGGPSTKLANIQLPRGATWTPAGSIIYTFNTDSSLLRVSVNGGAPVSHTPPDTARRISERFPVSTGAGDQVIFHRWDADGQTFATFEGGRIRKLMEATSRPGYADGHLFHVRSGNLIAQPIDPETLETRGQAIPLADRVAQNEASGMAAFSVSEAGLLSFFRVSTPVELQTRVYARSGAVEHVLTTEMGLDDISLGPDDRHIALMAVNPDGEGIDIWTYDLQRAVFTRVTFEGSADDPVWSPDGRWIAYASDGDLARVRASGVGGRELLFESEVDKVTTDWSPDGRNLVFINNTATDAEDLWTVDLSGSEPVARPLIATPFREIHGQFSPDGRWLAYTSDESGALQVYVVDFPELTQKIQVTRLSGSMPRWTKGGRELLVVGADRHVRSISMEETSEGWEIGAAERLFRIGIDEYSNRTEQYDASTDGERLVVLESSFLQQAFRAPITVVTDWRQLLAAQRR